MLCTGRILAAAYYRTPFRPHSSSFDSSRKYSQIKLKSNLKWRCAASASSFDSDASSFAPSIDSQSSSDKNTGEFVIIEGPETVQDFAKMELQEIQDNIRSRRNKIFLQMEEVRRLRIQQRLKRAELGVLKEEQETELPNFPSFIPFLPPLNSANLKIYYATCFSLISGIMIFGGLLAPTLELKLGIGGTSYADFIRSMHLPMQLRYAHAAVVQSLLDNVSAQFSTLALVALSFHDNSLVLMENREKFTFSTFYCFMNKEQIFNALLEKKDKVLFHRKSRTTIVVEYEVISMTLVSSLDPSDFLEDRKCSIGVLVFVVSNRLVTWLQSWQKWVGFVITVKRNNSFMGREKKQYFYGNGINGIEYSLFSLVTRFF